MPPHEDSSTHICDPKLAFEKCATGTQLHVPLAVANNTRASLPYTAVCRLRLLSFSCCYLTAEKCKEQMVVEGVIQSETRLQSESL